ncbi:hypothetical protein ACOBQB_05950 [Streptomyces sp. G5(2025)]|uniref:hypothetical protein n=1 Tax=Streptomyces sp. G5(2025) TaxID=3406628 RepID=UPI003C1C098E
MTSITGTLVRRAQRPTAAVAAAAVALVAAAGCGSSGGHAHANRTAARAEPSAADGARAAKLIGKAIDVTLGQDYLRSTRRMRTEGTTVMHSAVRGDMTACRTHARKGAKSLDWVVTPSALYTRGSKEALMLSPEAKQDPVRVKVMADRWVKRNAGVHGIMRDMCASKTRRDWLKERLPSLDELREVTPTQRLVKTRGRPTTKITYEWEGEPVEFHVAAQGTPFLLRVTNPAEDLDESFSDFGEPFRVTAPPGSATEYEMAAEVLAAQ